MSTWFKSDKNIWSLLKRNVSKGQLTGYILSNIIGLSVVLTGIMFYFDSNHSTGDEDKFFTSDYLVLSKRVAGIGFDPISFNKDDIERLSEQPWVKRIGKFTSSQFAVNAAVEMGGRGMSSYLFFESVPDEFFDVKPHDWKFDPEEGFVPIMLSKDYLALYNFGFAVPQGLPQVSEDLIGAIPIRLRLSGANQQTETFDAAIVGFSSRLNTIAVPQDFMDWANKRFSPDETELNPSRLIVEVDRLSGVDMENYLKSENLEVGGDKANDGNISKFLSTASVVVTTNGLIISSLAVFILILSIFLLLQKSREKLRNLMLLGYSPSEVSSYYERIVIVSNIAVTIVAMTAALFFRKVWQTPLEEIGLGGSSVVPMLLIAMIYLFIVTTINISVIRRYMSRIWTNK